MYSLLMIACVAGTNNCATISPSTIFDNKNHCELAKLVVVEEANMNKIDVVQLVCYNWGEPA